MNEPPNEKCGNCRYFQADTDECHRYAPTRQLGGFLGLSDSGWPTSYEDDWCGEYKAVTPSAPATSCSGS